VDVGQHRQKKIKGTEKEILMEKKGIKHKKVKLRQAKKI
jgi:hypothetical protein